MSQNLLIVFAKNITLGKVKTRLAKTVGDDAAFDVYKHLVELTEKQTEKLDNCDIHIHFSDAIISNKWVNKEKFVQRGSDLGERMQNAFQDSFDKDYEKIIGVGTDLPDLSAEIMQAGLNALKNNDCVFGPAEDGGYYLIGMTKMIPCIFEDKPWSQDGLLDITIAQLLQKGYTVKTLTELNDIDNIDDLRASSIAENFAHLLK